MNILYWFVRHLIHVLVKNGNGVEGERRGPMVDFTNYREKTLCLNLSSGSR